MTDARLCVHGREIACPECAVDYGDEGLASENASLRVQLDAAQAQRDAAEQECSILRTTNEAHCVVIEGALKILGAQSTDLEETACAVVTERDAAQAAVAAAAKIISQIPAPHSWLLWTEMCDFLHVPATALLTKRWAALEKCHAAIENLFAYGPGGAIPELHDEKFCLNPHEKTWNQKVKQLQDALAAVKETDP